MAEKNIFKEKARVRRAKRVRSRVSGTAEKPRLAVYKSLNHIYAQLVNDLEKRTITGVSSLPGSANATGKKTEKAKAVGKAIAIKAREMGITTVVFDRSGYLYHGKIKALADAAREAGLKF
jgi:large subunit ribosomal protein L18